MSARSKTVIITYYTITCDYCGRVAKVDNSYNHNILNSRNAVRSIGWTMQRNDKVKCDICRSHKK